jgi:hypothetical protein
MEVMTIDGTHGKHAQLGEQINCQVANHFLLVEQPKA